MVDSNIRNLKRLYSNIARIILIPPILLLLFAEAFEAYANDSIAIRISSNLSIRIEVRKYIELINGTINQFDLPQYRIKRRVDRFNSDCIAFYLDVYNYKNELIDYKAFERSSDESNDDKCIL